MAVEDNGSDDCRQSLTGHSVPSLKDTLASLDVSALVDDEGWPQIRYTLGGQS